MSGYPLPVSGRKSLWAGVFLISFSMLAFEIFCSRILTVVIGPHAIYSAIASAMLGMSSAGSLVSVMKRSGGEPGEPYRPALLSFLFGILSLAGIALISWLQNNVFSGNAEGKENAFSFLKSPHAMTAAAGICMFIPYFVFGLLIAFLFRSLKEKDYHLAYFADLAGAAAGALAAVAVLEAGGYHAAFGIVLAAAFLASGFFCRRRLFRAGTLILALTAMAAGFRPGALPEPRPEFRGLARLHWNIMEGLTAVEEWSRWGSLARVARLRYDPVKEGAVPPFERAYSMGRGEGMARFIPYDPEAGQPAWESDFSVLLPGKSLVMFAGTGAEMIQMNRECGGKCEITGVEINRLMIENALSFEPYRLREFFSRPGIRLHVEEGRSFLERHSGLYDFILYSASGSHGMKHIASSEYTAQYLFTLEGLRSALNHLEPDGILKIQIVNKARILAALREILNGEPLTYRVIITQPFDLLQKEFSWEHPRDQKSLYFKRSGFTADEWTLMKQTAENNRSKIILGPGGYADPEYAIYREIATRPDLDALIRDIRKNHQIDIAPRSDDRPYILDMSPGITAPRERALLSSVFRFSLAGLAVIFLPLLAAERIRVSPRRAGYAFFFFLTGGGFMLIEIGLVEKMNLLLGNPAYGAAFVLAALILSAGMGSYYSERLFVSGRLHFRSSLLLLLFFAGFLFAALHFGKAWLLALPFAAKLLWMAAAFFPCGFLMGQFFPQALKELKREEGLRYVPWAWAVQGAASMLAIGAALLIGRFAGVNCLLAAGMGLYLAAWFMPPAVPSRAG